MNKIYPPIRTAQYQLWQNGGQYNPPGMFWDGQRYRRGEANTGMQYMYGGQQYPPIRTAQYQLWENGGPVETAAYDMYKDGGIHIAKNKRGTFTAAASRHGKGVQEFASQVLANKENYSPAMVKKANFARNAAKWKHQYGGLQKFIDGGDVPGTDDYETDMRRRLAMANDPNDTTNVPIGPYSQAAGASPANTLYTTGQGQQQALGAMNGQNPQRPNPWQGIGYATNALENSIDAGLAIGATVNNYNNMRDVHRGAQNMGLTGMQGWMNQPGTKGDYHPNTGMFRPESYVPSNAGYYAPTMGQYGGQVYEHGGVYEIDENEAKRLHKLGYKLQMI